MSEISHRLEFDSCGRVVWKDEKIRVILMNPTPGTPPGYTVHVIENEEGTFVSFHGPPANGANYYAEIENLPAYALKMHSVIDDLHKREKGFQRDGTTASRVKPAEDI